MTAYNAKHPYEPDWQIPRGVWANDFALPMDRPEQRICADGSALAVRTPGSTAGWGEPLGLHAIRVTCHLHESFSLVVCHASDPLFRSASSSSNTGEITAMIFALEWVHQQPPSSFFSLLCLDSLNTLDEVRDHLSDSSRIPNGALPCAGYDVDFRKSPISTKASLITKTSHFKK